MPRTPLAILCLWTLTVTTLAQDRPFQPRRVVSKPLPAITEFPVVPAGNADLFDNELVLGVALGGQARAYPINMLTGPRREVLNDTLDGHAIAATW